MRDVTYPPIIATALAGFRLLGQRFQMTGTEHVPRSGGVLLAYNHIGYVDFIYGGLAARPSRRLVRFMAKRELFDHPVRRPADALAAPHRGGPRVGREVAGRRPGATSRPGRPSGSSPRRPSRGRWSSRSSRPARCGSPPRPASRWCPSILWGTQRMMTKDHPRDFRRGKTIALTVGEPMYPTGENAAAETAELKARMSALLDETIAAYPAERAAARLVVAAARARRLGPHARGGQGARRRGEARAGPQAGRQAGGRARQVALCRPVALVD